MDSLPTELHREIFRHLHDEAVVYAYAFHDPVLLESLTALYSMGLASRYYHAMTMPIVQAKLLEMRAYYDWDRPHKIPARDSKDEGMPIEYFRSTLHLSSYRQKFRGYLLRKAWTKEPIRFHQSATFAAQRTMQDTIIRLYNEDALPKSCLGPQYMDHFGQNLDLPASRNVSIRTCFGSRASAKLRREVIGNRVLQGLCAGKVPALMCLLQAFNPRAVKLRYIEDTNEVEMIIGFT